MKKLYCIVFGLGEEQENGLIELSKKYKIFGFDTNSKAKCINYCYKYFSKIDFKIISFLIKKYDIKHSYSFCTDFGIHNTGIVNQKFKLKGLNQQQALIATNKIYFKKFLKKNQISFAKYKICKINDIINIKRNFIQEKIFKPQSQSASRGVFVEKNIKKIKENIINFKKYYKNDFLVEEYLNDNIYAIDGWWYKNKIFYSTLSKKFKNKKISMSDDSIIFNYPNQSLIKQAQKLASKICQKLKINNLPIHLEFIKKKNKIYPIDFALRGAGSGIYNLIISKFNNYSSSKIQISLQEDGIIPKIKQKKFVAYIKFLSVSENTTFVNINSKYIKKIHKNIIIKLLKKKGTQIIKNFSSDDRVCVIYFFFKNFRLFKLKKKVIDNIFNKNINQIVFLS